MKVRAIKKLKLYGFNNLTKILSFNIYDICFAKDLEQQQGYIEYIDDQYNADRLTHILTDVACIIGAKIENIAKQDYDPKGASRIKRLIMLTVKARDRCPPPWSAT